MRPEIRSFLRTVANMLKDGERDEDGHEFLMENDDAVDTLHSLINEARRLESGQKLIDLGYDLDELEDDNPYSCHV